jgi:CheY-like chemotaxis protein/anti-sigma regulatory factor (Ser/Thr protein kinase)
MMTSRDDSTAIGDPGSTGEEATMGTVLVVDDSLIDRSLAKALVEKVPGWKAATANNGSEALAAIAQERPSVVLTDLIMPEMDGLKLVEALRSRYPRMPVILMTAHGSEDLAMQALRRGAASYVPKRSLARDLAETLEQIQVAVMADREHRQLLDHMTCLRRCFALENDPAFIPPLVSHLQQDLTQMGLCNENTSIRVGIALGEALYNALFHGNLEISSELRQEDDSAFYRMAGERRQRSPYQERRIHLDAELHRSESVYVIRDEGEGFDPSSLPDPTDPSNLEMASGRGLFLIRTFMDEVTFNDRGNQITMIKRHAPQAKRAS